MNLNENHYGMVYKIFTIFLKEDFQKTVLTIG